MLERTGQITLPPVSYGRHNPLSQRARPQPVLIDTAPIEDRLCRLQPLEVGQVRRTAAEPLFNSAGQNGKRLGRPLTAALHADQVRKLHRAGISKSEIARRLDIGRTSVRRVLSSKKS